MPKRDKKHDMKHDRWRNAVYRLDKYRCKMCGNMRSEDVQLEAHHIRRWVDHPELKYDLNNGISLCKPCHIKINNEEDKYIEQFDKLILERNVKIKQKKNEKKELENKIGKPSTRAWW